MKTVDQMIEDILDREGGFVDHSADTGGATNHGISLRYAKGIGLDLDHDCDVDKDDIRMVTREMAGKLYQRDFFMRPKLYQLHEGLQPQLFDISVNSGPHRAIELLQRACNNLLGTYIQEDGLMGPATRSLVGMAIAEGGVVAVNNELVDERIAFYERIRDRDPRQNVFFKGWVTRAQEFKVE